MNSVGRSDCYRETGKLMAASGLARRVDLSRMGSSDSGVMPRRALLEPHHQALPESFGTLPGPRVQAPGGESRGRGCKAGLVGMFLADPPRGGLRRLVRILRLEPRALVLIFVGTVLSSLVSLAQPLLAGSIVGVLQSGGFLAALPYGVFLAGLAVFASGITAVVNVVGAKAGNRTVRAFRDESAAIALRVPADKLV